MRTIDKLKSKSARAIAGSAIVMVLALPGIRTVFEQHMLSHMLIQLPLLVICGVWIADYILERIAFEIELHFALPLLLIALIASMFWMVPRFLDASLEGYSYFLLKFISLPLLVGIPLACGWRNVGPVIKSFFMANLLSMLIVLAWLYVEAPIRLCNYYLINEQQDVGKTIIYIALGISLYWVSKLFIGRAENTNINV
jgi:Na+/citrate or Na+/malate symporter